MPHSLFDLRSTPKPPPERPDPPGSVSIPLDGHEPVVEAGENVLLGQMVARGLADGQGDMHASLAGRVSEATDYTVTIQAANDPLQEAPSLDFSGLSDNDLARALERAGVDRAWPGRMRHLIINGVPPEPGISVNEQLLAHYRQTLAAGLEALRRCCEPTQVTLVALSGDASHFGNCTVAHADHVYPAGLDPLVLRSVTGRERDPESSLVSVGALYAIGQVLRTRRPVVEQPVTVAGETVMARIGTPARDLFRLSGIEPKSGDVAALGGLFRGLALYSLDQGLPKGAYGLVHVPADGRAHVRDAACTGCGECVPVCPARIRPDLISRAAEFKIFDRARGLHAEACMECGLCGWACPARRPLLQYIRLAKHEIALEDQEARAEALARAEAEEAPGSGQEAEEART